MTIKTAFNPFEGKTMESSWAGVTVTKILNAVLAARGELAATDRAAMKESVPDALKVLASFDQKLFANGFDKVTQSTEVVAVDKSKRALVEIELRDSRHETAKKRFFVVTMERAADMLGKARTKSLERRLDAGLISPYQAGKNIVLARAETKPPLRVVLDPAAQVSSAAASMDAQSGRVEPAAKSRGR